MNFKGPFFYSSETSQKKKAKKKAKKPYPYLTPCKSPGPIIQTSKPLFVASWRTTVK